MTNFQEKYLKYKTKYLELKEQLNGGGSSITGKSFFSYENKTFVKKDIKPVGNYIELEYSFYNKIPVSVKILNKNITNNNDNIFYLFIVRLDGNNVKVENIGVIKKEKTKYSLNIENFCKLKSRSVCVNGDINIDLKPEITTKNINDIITTKFTSSAILQKIDFGYKFILYNNEIIMSL